jgi:hypothetical protein
MITKGNEVMVVENLRGDDWRALAAIGNGKYAVVANGGAYIEEQ